MIVVVMGVCGCGKTSVGEALAGELGWPFFDADDFHPLENVEKMAAGLPLADADRWPWLDRLTEAMAAVLQQRSHAVFACSALRQAYRDRLARAGDVRFVHLQGDRTTIAARIAGRQHRYMPLSLLDSQFADLEAPADAIDVDVSLPLREQVALIATRLRTIPAAA
jgi:carbohydrate kinase (thermoresistant glucokinase family)